MAETADNQLVAADAKLNFDDNAAYRQKEIFTLRDTTQEDPREVYLHALLFVLYYIGIEHMIPKPTPLQLKSRDFLPIPGVFLGCVQDTFWASPTRHYVT